MPEISEFQLNLMQARVHFHRYTTTILDKTTSRSLPRTQLLVATVAGILKVHDNTIIQTMEKNLPLTWIFIQCHSAVCIFPVRQFPVQASISGFFLSPEARMIVISSLMQS